MSSSISLDERLARHNAVTQVPTRSQEELEETPTGSEPGADLEPGESEGHQASTELDTRKRRRNEEAMQHDASHVSQRLKLTKKDNNTLIACSKMPQQQRELYGIALGLKILTKLNTIQPVDAKFVIAEKLKRKIELYTTSAMLCPTTRGYIVESHSAIMGILIRHSTWGLTSEVKNNESDYKVVHGRVGGRLTDKRREFKSIIATSLGTAGDNGSNEPSVEAQDIIALVKTLGKIKGDSVFKTESIAITTQMLGRVAFLRLIYVECASKNKIVGNEYWKVVDKKLETIRAAYPGKDKASRTKESQFFKGILDDDMATYGQNVVLDLDQLDASGLSRSQRETEDAMVGIVTVLSDDESDGDEDDVGEE
ncbi:hypothetical protein BC629DRAFT_1599344 [Irpex lacteus]|nr:hypothetical protein BC629DRAFT_1599344 [Irpex lacteus]